MCVCVCASAHFGCASRGLLLAVIYFSLHYSYSLLAEWEKLGNSKAEGKPYNFHQTMQLTLESLDWNSKQLWYSGIFLVNHLTTVPLFLLMYSSIVNRPAVSSSTSVVVEYFYTIFCEQKTGFRTILNSSVSSNFYYYKRKQAYLKIRNIIKQ